MATGLPGVEVALPHPFLLPVQHFLPILFSPFSASLPPSGSAQQWVGGGPLREGDKCSAALPPTFPVSFPSELSSHEWKLHLSLPLPVCLFLSLSSSCLTDCLMFSVLCLFPFCLFLGIFFVSPSLLAVFIPSISPIHHLLPSPPLPLSIPAPSSFAELPTTAPCLLFGLQPHSILYSALTAISLKCTLDYVLSRLKIL